MSNKIFPLYYLWHSRKSYTQKDIYFTKISWKIKENSIKINENARDNTKSRKFSHLINTTLILFSNFFALNFHCSFDWGGVLISGDYTKFFARNFYIPSPFLHRNNNSGVRRRDEKVGTIKTSYQKVYILKLSQVSRWLSPK